MLKIVNDKDRLININPLVIYFVLSRKECEEYKDGILKLNNYVGFTRGIFKFEVLTKGDIDHTILPQNIISEFVCCNVFVRLIDSYDGAFNYLYSHIDLASDSCVVEENIIALVVRICNENITALKSLSQYVDNDNMAYSQIEKAIGIFNKAVANRRLGGGVWRSPSVVYGTTRLYNPNDFGLCDMVPGSSLHEVLGYAIDHKISSKAQRALDLIKSEFDEGDMQEILIEILGAFGNVSDFKSSNEIAKGVVNDHYIENIKRDHQRRFEPKNGPQLKICVKRVAATAHGKVNNKYGVEIEVDGKTVSIYFKSKDQTMLYIASLLCRKIDRPLYLNELYDKSLIGPKQKRERLRPWLKKLYNTIYLYPSKTFEEWFDGINQQRGRPMHQGKSQINAKIESSLNDMSDAIYYCILNTNKDSSGKSYYWLNCSPDEIELNSDMQQLCKIPEVN